MRFCFLVIVFLLALAGQAFSHPSDVSQMRVRVEQEQIEVRLTMNLLTLSRIAVIDADHNQRITPGEIASASPTIAAFLLRKIHVTVNDTDTDLGNHERYECVWPDATTVEVTDQEASQRYVDFTFKRRWPSGVREYWLGFECLPQLGELHTVQAIYQQSGHPDLPVEFSAYEPEYLYDTGWTEADFIETHAASRDFHPWALAFGVLAVLATVMVWLRNTRRAMT